MLDVASLPVLYSQWRGRYSDRDGRYDIIDEVVSGDFSVFDPDEERLLSSSPNMIQVALEDTAEAASLMPTIRVTPHRTTQGVKRRAEAAERICAGYAEAWKLDLLIPQTVMDLAAFGLAVWVVWPDDEQSMPILEKRDPRTCYPEPGFNPGEPIRRCMFAREVFFSQLCAEHQEKVLEHARQTSMFGEGSLSQENLKVTIVEWFDADEYVTAALYQGSNGTFTSTTRTTAQMLPVELERVPNKTGKPFVVLGGRITLDGEFRGQFDQVVDVQKAHVRLQSLLLDYADQSVYSDIWVKDLIGELSFGGGSFIELGPQGAIGRVSPAVTSMNVAQDLSLLVDGIHLGGRWPKSRPGEIDQAIASAKFLEASAGMMNTAIRTYHLLLKKMIQQAMQVALLVDKTYFPGPKTSSGILRNQEFLLEYSADDIDPKNRVRVEYGLGLGRDPSQAAVLHIQYQQGEYISKEFVQENIDGVTDVGRERSRIDAEKLRAMMFAKLLEGTQAGTISGRQLVEIVRARADGEDIVELYEKFIVEPEEQAKAGQVTPGMPGMDPMMPGMPAPGMGMPGPMGPGAPGGGMPPVPGAPNPPELLARLGERLPGGAGLLGTQVGSNQ